MQAKLVQPVNPVPEIPGEVRWFLDYFVYVLQNSAAKLHNLSIESVVSSDNVATDCDVYILMAVYGDLYGHVGFSMRERVALDLTEIILQTPQDFFCNAIGDCLGEIINLIAGNIAAHAASQNITINISPPSIFYKTQPPALIVGSGGGVQARIKSECGQFTLEIFLRKAA